MKSINRLSKISIYIMVSIYTIIILLTISLFLESRQSLTTYSDKITEKTINQVNKNYLIMDTTVKDLLHNTMNRPASTMLSLADTIYDISPEFYHAYKEIQEAKLPFIDSINIYNIPSGKFISSKGGWYNDCIPGLESLDIDFMSLPQLTAIPIVTHDTNIDKLVFAYIIHDPLYALDSEPNGIVILANGEWFFNNIETFNKHNGTDSFYLYHSDIGLISHNISQKEKTSINNICSQILAGEEPKNIITIDGIKWAINLSPINNDGFYLINLKNHDYMMSFYTQFLIKLFIISICFIALGTAVIIILNRKFITPYYSAVDRIRKSSKLELPDNDIELLNHIYNSMLTYSRDSDEQTRIIINCIRSLYFNELNTEQGISILQKRSIAISPETPAYVYLISIAYKSEEDEEEEEQQDDFMTARYQLQECVKEYFTKCNINYYSFFVKKDSLFVFSPNHNRTHVNEIDYIAEALYNHIHQSLQCHSILISSYINTLDEISMLNTDLTNKLSMKFLKGNDFLMLSESKEPVSKTVSESELKDLREKLLNNKNGNINDAADAYKQTLKKLSIQQAKNEINSCIFELSTKLASQEDTDNSLIIIKLLSQNTLDSFFDIITDYLAPKESDTGAKNKYLNISNKVKDIIETEYSDSNLCLKMTSEKLGMSSTYLGLIFKQNVGISFSEYLSLIRMQETVNMLENTKAPVLSIMAQVGITSESTFYRKFKEIYHMTPQAYRLQNKLEKN